MVRKTTRRQPTVDLDGYRESPLYPGIVRAVATILARSKFVAPVDVLVELGRLTPKAVEDWRRGRVPYLEKVVSGNLSRLSKLLRILRFHARDLNLVPSTTVYMRWGKGPKQRLRFTKTADPRLEEAYSRHFVWPGKRKPPTRLSLDYVLCWRWVDPSPQTGSDRGKKERRRGSRVRKRTNGEAAASGSFTPSGPNDEPRAEGDDWVVWGDELILEMGATAGGTPYGISLQEFRVYNERDYREAGWARAKRVLREVLTTDQTRPGDEDIGWVRHLSRGLSYDVYCADCNLTGEPGSPTRTVVVRLPLKSTRPGLDERGRRELRLLEYLAHQDLRLRLPDVIGSVCTPDGIAFAQEAVFGLPLDLRAGRQRSVRPWEVVATVAAACHEVDPVSLRSVIPYFPTRRDHAVNELSVLEKLPFTEAAEALAWAHAHLPPPEPSRLLHGDLLGQNIVLDVESDDPPGVLDWEYARVGDPAYDLAIVTRGTRRPFQIAGGLERLVNSYNERATAGISCEQVHLHELCLKARFFLADRDRYGEGSPTAQQAERTFISVLRRATGA